MVFNGATTILLPIQYGVIAPVIFVVMLPLTIGMLVLMFIGGAAALFNFRYRLRNLQPRTDSKWQSHGDMPNSQTRDNSKNPPIEGTFTVVERRVSKR